MVEMIGAHALKKSRVKFLCEAADAISANTKALNHNEILILHD